MIEKILNFFGFKKFKNITKNDVWIPVTEDEKLNPNRIVVEVGNKK